MNHLCIYLAFSVFMVSSSVTIAQVDPNLVFNGTRLDASDDTTTVEDSFRGGIVFYRTEGTSDQASENFIHSVTQQLDLIDTTTTGHRMLNNLASGNATSPTGHTVGIFDRAHFDFGRPSVLDRPGRAAVTLDAVPGSSRRHNIRPDAPAGEGTDSFLILPNPNTRSTFATTVIVHELSHVQAFQNGTAVPSTPDYRYPGQPITIGNLLEEMENIGLIHNPNRGGISQNTIVAELRAETGNRRYSPYHRYGLISVKGFLRNFQRVWPEGYDDWLDAARGDIDPSLFTTPSCSDYFSRCFNPFRRPDGGGGGGPAGIGAM